ncbi:MAG: hopanoid biosynthesis-associated RND transporter HpnN [Methylobacter sp.]|nr:MAG: hopanoid biosynthesis-associated RND transporter HpnN [Methylobacter sp.]
MTFKTRSHIIFSHWGNLTLGRPFVVLAIVVLLGVLALQYTAGHLSINTDTAELIAPDAPFQQNRRNYEKAFSQDMHTLLLVVESDTPELTKAATKRLLRLMSADKAHFNSAYIPNDSAFFRQNGLLYLDADELQTLSNNLSLAQPFIGRIAQEPNLTGFFSIFEDALTSADKAQVVPIDLTSLVDKVASALHKTLNDGNALLSWESLISNRKNHSDNGFIIVSPKFDFSQIRPAETAIDSIRKAVAQVQDPDLPAVKVWVTGEVGLEDDELSGMSTGTFTASIFSIVLVLFILLIAYRSVLLTVATLITLALGMLFCGMFAAFSVKELNLISVAFAVSNIGLGVEYAIHFCLRYRDNLIHHIHQDLALRSTLISTAPSLLLCAGTTSIGLYAFIPTDYKGVSELGLLAGTSLFICLLITLIALPALLSVIPVPAKFEKAEVKNGLAKLSEKLAILPLHYAKPISIATLVIAVISIVLTCNVKTDFNPINLRDPNTESVIAFKNLMKDKETTPMTLTVLAKDENSAKVLQQKLSALATVDKTVSLFDFQPADQDDKLAVIEEMSLMLGAQTQSFPALKPDTDPVPGINRLIKAIDTILPQKTDAHERTALSHFKQELQDILIELDARQQTSRTLFIDKVQGTLLGTLPNLMNELSAGFNAKKVTLADLPPEIKDKWLSKNGSYRIQIFPKKDLSDLASLEEFITQVQSVAPETTDLPIMYWESMKEVISAFQEAIVIALITIALLLFAIRRNIFDTALVMTPLILAGLFTMASAVITGTPINFANIIALPLLLGLGVDNGIHMVEKLHHSLSEEQNIYQSSTARAMFYGALTTASSFAGLAFSPHQGIASMGLIITMGIFWIMVCTFVILPALSKLVLRVQA